MHAIVYVHKAQTEFSVSFRSLKALVTHWLRADRAREPEPPE